MWQPKARVHPHAPVVALDVDGTMGDWHEHFRAFASLYLNTHMAYHWEPYHFGNVEEALGIDKALYRELKLAFRQGGWKRWMPMFPGMNELTTSIRDQGYQVWICSTRPWLRLDNIDKDTAFWLDQHGIQFDGVLFGEEKYEDLVDIVGRDRVVCVVDDLPECHRACQMLDLPVAIRSGAHNEYWKPNVPAVRLTGSLDMGLWVQQKINEFEKGHM
jgi:hypothetical protein